MKREKISTDRLKRIRHVGEALFYDKCMLGKPFPIVEFMEWNVQNIFSESGLSYDFEVVEDAGNFIHGAAALAEIKSGLCSVRIGEQFYEKAIEGDNFSRFTLAHELGHIILHRKSLVSAKARKALNNPRNIFEKEANIFAAAIMLPFHALDEDDDRIVARNYGVSVSTVVQSRRERRLLYPGPRGF